VKPGSDCDKPPGSRGSVVPGRIDMPCVAVRTLIANAYGAFAGAKIRWSRPDVVGGPGWIDKDHFDIAARAPGAATTQEMLGPMMQSLLEDRFQLKVHVEKKDTPVFELTVAKSSPNLHPSQGPCTPVDLSIITAGPPAKAPDGAPRMCGAMRGHGTATGLAMDFFAITMEEFATRTLETDSGRPVIDKTGLTGRYDFQLEFSPRLSGSSGTTFLDGEPSAAAPAPDDAAGPSIFNALQNQLGLKLSAAKAPLDTIVIDSVEKPSAN